jgi:hypothetical protein
MSIVLLPKPRTCKLSRKRSPLAGARWIQVPAEAGFSLKAHFIAFARETSLAFNTPLNVSSGTHRTDTYFVRATLGARGLPTEGYRLVCGGTGILLEGRDEAGLFYGLQTLRQLLAQTAPRLPQAFIEDYPAFPTRGFMLDVSRCKVPTMRTLYEYVDMLAAFKINHLQLYTEHTFAYTAHGTVWHDASPLTAEEIITLDAYCRERYIELAANQNSFGHFERWLIHPDYHHLAESPAGFRHPLSGMWMKGGSTLKPDRTTLSFLDELYAELLPNFTSTLFNVGCDETWELGMGRSRRLCERKGKNRVYLDFLTKIEKLVGKYGRRMMFWGDIILEEPSLIGELPRDIVALDWGYEADHRFSTTSSHFAASGIPFFVCPGTSSWNSLLGRTDNCLRNIAAAARNGYRNGATGLLTTDWGDNGHHQYKPISTIGILAGAACSWSHRTTVKNDIVDALNLFVFQDATGVMGRVLYDLGNLYTKASVHTRNSSVFNHLLFWDMQAPLRFKGRLSTESAGECVTELDRLEKELKESRAGCGDAEVVRAELCNAMAMVRHGLDRYHAHHNERAERLSMRKDLLSIIGEHERLWLCRNRPGGLHESSQKLRELLLPLER